MQRRYSDFHGYVIEHFSDLETTTEEYFTLDTGTDYLWKNFEQDLATLDHGTLFDSFNHINLLSETFKPSEAFGLEDEIGEIVDQLIEDIKVAFKEWVEQIEFPQQKAEKFEFQVGAKYINFNYTDTLESLYNLPKKDILYIHNKVNNYREELIFGHGLSEEPNPVSEDLDDEGNSNRTLFSDAQSSARYPFFALMKNTNEIIEEHRDDFEHLRGFSEIIVLGHSLGKVDWPYFKLLHQKIPDAKWKISFYSKEERDLLYSITHNEIAIGSEKIEMIRINDDII
ncbi:hypothetical protein GCM10022289_01340 [Pedobacter jeongneungensis]|uniref:Bacteriophage abortive infection AbiH n=2 Tax=Pedobacter jeongneungensis TaxID=947309 RepID=A0ABP8B2I4_9SPHI